MLDFLTRSRPDNHPAPSGAPDGAGTLVLLSNVEKTFETAAGPFTVLRGIDLRVAPGEFVGITGRSGSGKSTLLNVLTGIDRPTSGQVRVCGADLAALDENKLGVWRGKNVGIVFQFFQLLPTLSVLDNVMLPMDFAGLHSPRERAGVAMALLEHVGLADQAEKLPSALSGGQQQRQPSPEPWPTIHHCLSPMSQPAISIRRPQSMFSHSSNDWPATEKRS